MPYQNFKALFLGLILIFSILLIPIFTQVSIGQTDEELSEEELTKGKLLEELKEELAAKEREAEELEKQAQELNVSIEETQKQKDSLSREISLINSRIGKLGVDIRYTRNRISKTNLEIKGLTIEIKEKIFDIENKSTAMAVTLQIIYETSQEDPFIVLLRNESITGVIDHINQLSSLENNLFNDLKELKALKELLTGQKTKQENFKGNLTKLSSKLTDQQKVEAWQKNQKNTLLKETKNQEKEYRENLIKINQRREEIAREIFEIEEKTRLTIDPDALPTKRPGVLTWPVPPLKITQTYGPTSATGFKNDFYKFHNGLDLRASIGTAVTAADNGEIIGVGDNSPYTYGRWVAIKHANNLVTLYAHLSVIKVKKGQSVKRGDTIAFTGNTGFSTGPHLHFGVYAGDTFKIVPRWFGLLPLGGSVNPSDYL